MFKKVIVSHLGELNIRIRTIVDIIRYCIYYRIPAKNFKEIMITDQLDQGLHNNNVFTDERNDSKKHIITWIIRRISIRRRAYVEFEATLPTAGALRNQAWAANLEVRPKETDTGKFKVIVSPLITAWTIRFKTLMHPVKYSLFDQIWLNPRSSETPD